MSTYHIFHLIATCYFETFPSNYQWWLIQLPALLLAVLLGEYLCMQAKTARGLKLKEPSKSFGNGFHLAQTRNEFKVEPNPMGFIWFHVHILYDLIRSQ